VTQRVKFLNIEAVSVPFGCFKQDSADAVLWFLMCVLEVKISTTKSVTHSQCDARPTDYDV